MSKRDPKTAMPAVPELPDDVRGVIQGEIDSSLSSFREGDFEGRLRTAVRAEARRDGRKDERRMRADRPRRSALRRWAPVYAVGLIALAVLIAVPSKIQISKSKPNPMLTALGKLPGIQSLNRVAQDQPQTVDSSVQAEPPLLRPLAVALSSSVSASAPGTLTPPILTPRYSLEQKIKILTEERPIERALVLMKSISGEV